MSAQEAPALPGEEWRGVIEGRAVCVVARDGEHDAYFWLGEWIAQTGYFGRRIAIAWALSLRARVADLERDLAEYRAADRAGKDTV